MNFKNYLLTLFFVTFYHNLFGQAVAFEWLRNFGKNEFTIGLDLETTENDDIFVSGFITGTVDFGTGSNTIILKTKGSQDGFLLKMDTAGNTVWARQFTSNRTSYLEAVQTDDSGNIYVAGVFDSRCDLDPGPGTYFVNPVEGNDIFVVKLDSNGDFVWGGSFGGDDYDTVEAIELDDEQNIILCGSFVDNIDFDISDSTEYRKSARKNGSNGYVLKLDNEGNYKWVATYGIPVRAGAVCIDIDSDEENALYVCGHFIDSMHYDSSGVMKSIASIGGLDFFVQKLDSSGSVVWTITGGAKGRDQAKVLHYDEDYGLTVAGSFQNTVDFDPSKVVNARKARDNDVFILNYSKNGVLKTVANFGGGSLSNLPEDIYRDKSGRIYLAGTFGGNIDFDPGSSKYPASVKDSVDVFFMALDSNMDFLWVNRLHSTKEYEDYVRGIRVDSKGDVYGLATYNRELNLIPNSNNLKTPKNTVLNVVLLKMDQDSCSAFTFSYDSIRDARCGDSSYVQINVRNGKMPYAYEFNGVKDSDSLFRTASSGFNSIKVSDAKGCSAKSTLYLGGPKYSKGFDLEGALVSRGFRPGTSGLLRYDVLNTGCNSQSVNCFLVLDTNITYVSAVPSPSGQNGDTLFWNLGKLNYDSSITTIKLRYTTSKSAKLGSSIVIHQGVYPISGDTNPTNNFKRHSFIVRNSYDPNDKAVYPQLGCTGEYALSNEPIDYTIRFQNTGNAEAIHVSIVDTLSTSLDVHSLEILGSSHPNYFIELKDTDVLEISFPEIDLPDSTTNQELSEGYIMFRLWPRKGLPNRTTIRNRCGIYFDFNPPIITNYVNSIVVDSIPAPVLEVDSIVSCSSIKWIDGKTYESDTLGPSVVLETKYGCDSTITLNFKLVAVDTTVSRIENALRADADNAEYQWLSCDSSYDVIAGAVLRTFEPSTDGRYAVEITKKGCVDTSSCIYVKLVSISGIDKSTAFVVAPNPTHDHIRITNIFKSHYSLKIYSPNGELLQNIEDESRHNIRFALPEKSGMYLVRIHSGSEQYIYRILRN